MKMLISMVIEACANDIHEIKGKILETACEAIVSCSVDVLPEQKKEVQVPSIMECHDRKMLLNAIYGKDNFPNVNNGGH